MALFRTDDGIIVSYDSQGSGAPVLLLHGFPQTRALWNRLAPRLAEKFTVVTADLRGYGASGKPKAGAETYSFRSMAGDVSALMTHLGHERFHLVGHDRGARVAHRLALDTPDRVETLTLMDILPTLWLAENWSFELANAYYHWSFLAQPAPLPEAMIEADPDGFFKSCLAGWGGASPKDFPDLDAFRAAWRDPDTIRAMVADYRTVPHVDVEHDGADRDVVLDMPSLVLWGVSGVMGRMFDVAAIWSERLSDMRGQAIPGGHFFVDQSPEETSSALHRFLSERT